MNSHPGTVMTPTGLRAGTKTGQRLVLIIPPRDRDDILPRESRSVARAQAPVRAQASGREMHLVPYPPPESRNCVLPRASRGVARGDLSRAPASERAMQEEVTTAVVGHLSASIRATPVIAAREGLTARWEMSHPWPPATSVRASPPEGDLVDSSHEFPLMTQAARF